MKKISVALLISLVVLVTACASRGEGEANKEAEPQATVQAKVPVEVAKVETGDISLVFAYNGNLQAKDDIKIYPSVAGTIEKVLVSVGDVVKEGDPIAIVDKSRYMIAMKQAQTALKAAQLNLNRMTLGSRPEEISTAQAAVQLGKAAINDVANVNSNDRTRAAAGLASAEAALRKAQTEYDKIAWAGDVGATKQALDLEQATIAYEAALASYNSQTNPRDSMLAPLMVQLAQAELALALKIKPFREVDFEIAKISIEQAQAGIELAQIQLNDTIIKAPFSGLIAELYIAKGSSVSQQSPLVRYLSKEMEVAVNVEESRINEIKKGQYAALRVSAYPGQDFPAVVTSIAPLADKDTRTFMVKVAPIDKEGQLKSGMFANVSLLADEKKGTILAPRTSITLINDEPNVYVLNDNKVELRAVTTGISDDARVEVLSGLKDGDTVVIMGQPNLIDGAFVEVVNK